MALNSRSSIDPRWVTHNQSVGYGLQLATVEIYDADFSTKTYDAVSNTWSGTSTSLYTGPARIQPLASNVQSNEDFNPTLLQSVRVQIPYGKNTVSGSGGEMPDIRPNHRMKVTSCATNPVLEEFYYVVVGVMNSSNAWERTLVCKVDTELGG